MKHTRINEIHKHGIIQDLLIGLLIFTILFFIDLQLAFFVSVICISILLCRRIVYDLNPGFIRGHKIYFKGMELNVPDGVDIFDLGNADYLLRYVEVIRNLLAPPRVLIIRCNKKFSVSQLEISKLYRVIKLLELNRISLVFSDVNATVQNQFRQNGISEMVKEGNIFFYIKDALAKAVEVMKQVQIK